MALAVVATMLVILTLDKDVAISRLAQSDERQRLQMILDAAYFKAVVHPTAPTSSITLAGCEPEQVSVAAGGVFSEGVMHCINNAYVVTTQGELLVFSK